MSTRRTPERERTRGAGAGKIPAAALRLVRPDPELRDARRVVVPEVDARTGAPLPPWRVSLWHLREVGRLLGVEYASRAGSGEAADFAKAADVAAQLALAVEASAGVVIEIDEVDGRADSRAALLEMRHAVRRPAKLAQSEVERALVARLPPTAAEARSRFVDPLRVDLRDEAERQGARNLAGLVFGVLSAHAHVDAARLRARWKVAGGREHASPTFLEDVEDLGSYACGLMAGGPTEVHESFAHAVVRRAYRIAGLKRPFEAEDKSERRAARPRRR